MQNRSEQILFILEMMIQSAAGHSGTLLIVLGDDSLPRGPSDLPEPLVQGRLQLPTGVWLAGEASAPAASRDEADTWRLWGETLRIVATHPLGVGTGNLARQLNAAGAGLGPGLTARDQLLQAAGEWGVGGAAGLLVLIVAAAWWARRSANVPGFGMLLLTVILMAGESLLAEPVGQAAAWLVLGMCLAPAAAAASSNQAERAGPREAVAMAERPSRSL